MDGSRIALIVASDSYADPGLGRLRAPASDAEALAAVLRDPQIGGFEVRTLLNAPAHEVNLAVEEFFDDRRPDDLLLLHVSGHGVKDEGGELYFAAANTQLRRLGATAVAAEFVNRRMGRSRSRRVVLLLDCCYAGAFERGMTARAGSGMDIEEHFGGRGRAVITASSAMEYAFEGDELTDSQVLAPSVFTSALVEGLRTGEADRDQDGFVALDELYDYVYDKVREATPNQTPGKWTFGVQGELVIARRGRPVTTPSPLPAEVQQAAEHPLASVRAAAVQELAPMLHGQHAGLALAAKLALERLTGDDSRRVAAAATEALGAEAARPAPGAPPVVAEPAPAPASVVQGGPSATAVAEAAPERPVRTKAPVAEAAADAAPAVTRPRVGVGEVTGLMAVVAAALMVSGLFGNYQNGSPLSVVSPAVATPTLVLAALAATAGACVLVPPTRRLVGTGLLLGAAPVSISGLIGEIGVSASEGGAGGAFIRIFLGDLAVVLAACLAGFALARSAGARLARGRASDRRPRFLTLIGLGVAGAVPVAMFGLRVLELTTAWEAAPVLWMAVMALAVPALVAVAVPRQFAAALLAGWTAGAGAAAVYWFTAATMELNKNGYDAGRIPIAVFGATLLALVVVAVQLGRAAPASADGRDAAA